MNIEMFGFASIRFDKVRQLGDLRAVVKYLDDRKIHSDTPVEWDRECVWIEIADSNRGSAVEFIECGDHIPPDTHYDVIINTHTHEPEKPKDPAPFDWPTIDRYGDDRRPE